jgi:Zn-dependent peptidase ImmA (M78 family)/transcriptional regulator with XRE-family HTH domain
MAGFNFHMLCLARDACGMTQAEFALRLGIGQGTLSKYEAGLLVPPDETIDEFVRVIGRYTRRFFFQPERPYGFPPFHFRKRKKLGVKALNRIVAEMNVRRIHVKRLSTAYPTQSSGFIPEVDLDEYQGASKRSPTIEDLARHVRELWGVPNGPIDNMVELVERNGGIVIPCEFGTELLDAMSQRIDGMPVVFFINPDAPADRIRHTLAHELGHMVLHTLSLSEDESMEDEADAFAGAFLLPADEIRPQLKRFDLRQLANLKSYWKVSMAALAVRADRLNLITPYQKKSFWMEMARLGYRKREPNEPSGEYPQRLSKMVKFHQRDLGYSRTDMAALLDLTPEEFDRLYGQSSEPVGKDHQSPTRLQLVK